MNGDEMLSGPRHSRGKGEGWHGEGRGGPKVGEARISYSNENEAKLRRLAGSLASAGGAGSCRITTFRDHET